MVSGNLRFGIRNFVPGPAVLLPWHNRNAFNALAVLPFLRAPARGPIRATTGSAHQLLFQVVDDLAHLRIDLHAVIDQAAGVEDGAVVAPAKGFADAVE